MTRLHNIDYEPDWREVCAQHPKRAPEPLASYMDFENQWEAAHETRPDAEIECEGVDSWHPMRTQPKRAGMLAWTLTLSAVEWYIILVALLMIAAVAFAAIGGGK